MKKISLLLFSLVLSSCGAKTQERYYYKSHLNDFKNAFYYFCLIDSSNVLFGKETLKNDSFSVIKPYTKINETIKIGNEVFAIKVGNAWRVYEKSLKFYNEEYRVFEKSGTIYKIGV